MKEKAEHIILNSTLPQEDKQMWVVHFETAPYEAIVLFLGLFEESVDDLPLATENLRKKIDAHGDIDKMKQIMREDKKMILSAATA